MKFITLLATAALAVAQCTNPIVRSEWAQLTSSQKDQFVQACVALAKRPLSNQYSDPTTMSWADFTITHSHNSYWAHGNAQFYPYHRAMLWQFEVALHSTGLWPANMGTPYFDWSAMSQNWWTSDIFSPQYFGSINNAADSVNHCVVDGAFKKGVFQVAPDADNHRSVTGSDTTCLRRTAQQAALTDATTITQSLSATSFVTFTADSANHYYDETNYHAAGHGVLGGGGSDMGNPSVSPNDPLFWLHHGFVDKYYWRWQQLCPAFKQDYGGILARADDPVSSGTNAATSNLYVDSWPFTVDQLLDTEGGPLCYTYSKSGGDLPPPAVTCPNFTPKNSTNTPPPTKVNIDDVWMNKLFNSLISQRSLSFSNTGTGSAAAGVQAVDAGVVFGRRDNETSVEQDANETSVKEDAEQVVEEPKEAYLISNNTDGSQTVSYVLAEHTIEVAAGYEILIVGRGSVTTRGPNGKYKRFYPEILPYVYVPNGSGNIVPGSHPCHLAYPKLLSKSLLEDLGKDYTRYLSIRARVMEKIDIFNADNCTTLYSPSSAMNQAPVVLDAPVVN
ncbi:UNVERIFIED_CONTAM: hypothetical protein HDU68_004688 [Siphonaria sp. JEL0065]|nr:hypothetical protein HDU68_004688 [Siphonaria sp. JEL0065]